MSDAPLTVLPGMSALEIAAGGPIGFEPDISRLVTDEAPMLALEETVRDAVVQTPCCVAFSGGRDSSLVLAAAVRVAAKEGVPPPIAVTTRFPQGTQADERDWQELVLDHLGLERQVVVAVTDELDLIGTLAAEVLERHGVVFPPNIHMLSPLLPPAAGGSLLLGTGGDELFSYHRWEQLNDLLARRRRPRRSDIRPAAAASLPGPLRRRLLARRARVERPWLRAAAGRRVRALESRDADEPVRFDRAVARAVRRRALLIGHANIRRLGRAAGVNVHAPLAEPRFVAALARAGGARGWGGRTEAMRAVAGGILPDALIDRRDKAIFNAAFFGERALRFAHEWSGRGLDTSLVDPDVVRRAWLDPEHQFRSALLLQQAWLHDRGR